MSGCASCAEQGGGKQPRPASGPGKGVREQRLYLRLSSGVCPARTPAAPAQNPNRAPTSPTPRKDRTISGSDLGCLTAGDDDHDQGLNRRDQGEKQDPPNPKEHTLCPRNHRPSEASRLPGGGSCAARLPAQNTTNPAPHSSPTHLSSSSVMVPSLGSASTLFPQNLSFG